MASAENAHWHPFEEKIEKQREVIKKPVAMMRVPPMVTSILLVIVVICVGLFFLFMAYFQQTYVAIVFAIIGVVLAIILWILNWLSKVDEYRRWALFKIADANGWSFMSLNEPIVKTQVNLHMRKVRNQQNAGAAAVDVLANKDFSREGLKKFAEAAAATQDRQRKLVRDPRVQSIYDNLHVLMGARLGQPIPTELQALYWGQINTDLPFWMGLQLGETDLTFAAEALKTDARGNVANYGHMLQFVVGYPLAKSTGIDAYFLAEALGRDGWFDFKTESSEFNAAFNITIRNTSDEHGADAELALTRFLTPATQVMLLDLKTRYKAQFVLRGDVVFMSGYDLINLEEIEQVTSIASEIAQEFAQAAASFKHYTE